MTVEGMVPQRTRGLIVAVIRLCYDFAKLTVVRLAGERVSRRRPMIKPAHFLALASFTALAASAVLPPSMSPAVAQSGPQCFRANELYGYSPGPGGFVNIRTSGNRWFQMRLTGGCPDFGWIMQIGIRPMESSWLCEGHAQELIAPHPGGLDRCYVSEIRPIIPAS
jgi:hypothetical protein